MIYCVVPESLSAEIYEDLIEYYKDDPNVEVIEERRYKERGVKNEGGGKRKQHERRRSRIPGTFPKIGPDD